MIKMAELIKRLVYNCPFCDEEHEISVIKDKTKALINNTPIECEEIYYYCPIEDDKFVPEKLIKQNLLAARDSYRTLNGLLTSNEIKEIRSSYGLSQREFANLLGWGDVTIQRYESKSIQDETYDQKLRFVRDNPKAALDELERHKNKFEKKRYMEVKNILSNFIETRSVKFLNKEIIESLYIHNQGNSWDNGYTKLDLEKIENMITFFAVKSSRLYKVKLMKLLWYADALFCKKYGKGMSGLVYKHLPFGAVPQAHEEILKYSQSSIKITEEYIGENISYKISSKKDIDLSKFNTKEIYVLQTILEKFDHMGSREISEYMHNEIAYKETNKGDIIPYNIAREINDF